MPLKQKPVIATECLSVFERIITFTVPIHFDDIWNIAVMLKILSDAAVFK
jgi:hypothetical protein